VVEMEGKRLIEVDFPLKEVSIESVREKNIRYGHISTLHIWWARRPLAASRAVIFAALVPATKNREHLRKKLEFLAELSKWENSQNQRIIQKARQEIRNFFGRRAPRVLDCFAGGGSIPLEALRLGCETYALELNPVAVLILKAILEYPQEFGKLKTKTRGGLQSANSSLLEDLKKWKDWVFEEARKEIGKFYPPDPDGSIPVGYIWARTVRCQNPSCKVEIPLMRQFWLIRKENKKIALRMVVDKKRKRIDFKIVQGKDTNSFNPSQGTTRKATVFCPLCGSGMNSNTLRREAKDGKMGQRLIAVVLYTSKSKGKTFRVATEHDLKVFKSSVQYLGEKVKNWRWDFNPIPNEPIPTPDRKDPSEDLGLFFNFAPIVLYGIRKWGDLFNDRQKLALITFTEKVKLAYERMIEKGYTPEYAKAVTSFLSLGASMMAAFNNSLARWENTAGAIKTAFGRQALPMVWDYAETNPFSGSTASWQTGWRYYLKVIEHCSQSSDLAAFNMQGTATRLPYPNNFFDAVVTDPPYYDNVPYSDLSDFFYVWLKRIVGDIYPELFSTPLTPKSQEVIESLSLLRGAPKNKVLNAGKIPIKSKHFFEDMITRSFEEIYRVLKTDGIAVIVFAYKSTDAWETIINSLLKSGLVLTASWPIHTEMKARLRAMESAALASSVYMVCRKRTKEKVAYFSEIRNEIETRIKEKLTQFWEQGISGADFFVSAIGPAVEVFGKYSKVEKLSGEEVSVKELLEYVRKVVSEFALERVLKRADLGGVDAKTRFYLLWRWTFGNVKVHFDDAIKLSRPMGVELTDIWDRGELVKKEKEFIRVLGPEERAKDPSFMKKTRFTSMIDVLHYVLILWERGEREKIKEILSETGYGENEFFWQTAQALSEMLLQGFLYGKEVYIREARRKTSLLDFVESE